MNRGEREERAIIEVVQKTEGPGLPLSRYEEIKGDLGDLVDLSISIGDLAIDKERNRIIMGERHRTVDITFSQENIIALTQLAKKRGMDIKDLVHELVLVGLGKMDEGQP